MVGHYGGRKLFEYGYLGGYRAIVQLYGDQFCAMGVCRALSQITDGGLCKPGLRICARTVLGVQHSYRFLKGAVLKPMC